MKNDTKLVIENTARRLVEAIRAAYEPVAPTPREQLLRFAWYAISSLDVHREKNIECFPLFWTIRSGTFAQYANGYLEAEQALEEAMFHAYNDAVRFGEPFADFLTPVYEAMVGEETEHCVLSTLVGADSNGVLNRQFSDLCCDPGALTLAELQQELEKDWPHVSERSYFANDADPLRVALMTLHVVANQITRHLFIGNVVLGVGDVSKKTGRMAMASGDIRPLLEAGIFVLKKPMAAA